MSESAKLIKLLSSVLWWTRVAWPLPAPGQVSRQSEKFLIGQSRKFLLTAVRQKDGTNRDEPRGTGQVGVAEADPGQDDQPAGGGRAHGSQRTLGAQAVEA